MNTLQLSIIVATGLNNEIGKDNQLLWHIPADLKYFKETTLAHTIIMGRKTFDSVGRPLPKRRNIVISRDTNLVLAGAEVVNSLQQALELCSGSKEEIFIVGGAQIYKEALAFVKTLYITKIHGSFDADTFFPEITPQDWELVNSLHFEADENNKYPYTFLTYKRI